MTVSLSTVVDAALLAIKNKAAIHYTQNSPARWVGIHDGLVAANGQYPHYADCSSFATWCLWQVLGHGPDTVNGTGWKSGYTGTLAQHGHTVSAEAAQAGDLVFYGHPIYHVAIVIGRKNGVLLVASNGEESGPYIVKYNQWPVNSIRRYLPDAPKPTVSTPASTVAPAWPKEFGPDDVLGPVDDPSNHVHGYDPRYDSREVHDCIWAVQVHLGKVLGRKVTPTGTFGPVTKQWVLDWRAAHDPKAKGVFTLGRDGYEKLTGVK